MTSRRSVGPTVERYCATLSRRPDAACIRPRKEPARVRCRSATPAARQRANIGIFGPGTSLVAAAAWHGLQPSALSGGATRRVIGRSRGRLEPAELTRIWQVGGLHAGGGRRRPVEAAPERLVVAAEHARQRQRLVERVGGCLPYRTPMPRRYPQACRSTPQSIRRAGPTGRLIHDNAPLRRCA